MGSGKLSDRETEAENNTKVQGARGQKDGPNSRERRDGL